MNRPPHILFVEDEPALGKIVSESLENKGFRVCWAHSGSIALKELEEFSPDLCVLDVMLPGMNGYELAREIRTQISDTPIIFLTAKTQTKDVVAGFEAGGNDYIRKPFSLEELVLRIENLLELVGKGKKSKDLSPVHPIGSYTYYPSKYELHHEGNFRVLSHREAQIFQLFLQHPNEVISRKYILKQVWGDDSFFNSRTLDVYMRRIREYLCKDESLKIITLKGVGYQFYVDS